MKTGTARYAQHYEIAAYGESAMRWGYNYWWAKTFSVAVGSDHSKCARTTEADIACGWGLTEGSRSDIRISPLKGYLRPDQMRGCITLTLIIAFSPLYPFRHCSKPSWHISFYP